jgi:S1-C subfamily serine protease
VQQTSQCVHAATRDGCTGAFTAGNPPFNCLIKPLYLGPKHGPDPHDSSSDFSHRHCASHSPAGSRAGPPRAGVHHELRLSYAPVVQKAAPSVVNVYAARVVANRNPFMDDPFFRRFFGGGRRQRSRCSARSARA